MKKISACLLAAGLLAGPSFLSSAEPQGETPSAAYRPQKRTLDNGLTVITTRDESSRTSALHIYIRGGQRIEPEGLAGLSFMTTRLCLEIPDQNKMQDLMDQATVLHMSVQQDFSRITVSCLSEYLEETLALVASILRKPLFSGIRIDRIKKDMHRRAQAERDEPSVEAHLALLGHFWRETPFAGSFYGNALSIDTIKKRDITAFYENNMLTGQMVVSAVSDLANEKIAALVERQLGTLTAGALPRPPLPPRPRPEFGEFFIEKQSHQALVAVGYALPPLNRRNYLLTSLLETLLGKGVGSRLWPLRAKEKLAYNVNARVSRFLSGGLLEAYLETDASQQQEALDSLILRMDELHRKGVDEAELAVTRTFTRAMQMRGSETKQDRAASLGWMETLDLGYDLLEQLPSEIESVSAAEFNAFIREWLAPEKRAIVIVGPKQ